MTPSILSTQAVSKTYGAVVAVSNLDFSLREGEVRAIIGPNGAGKSTLAKLLYGETIPDKGIIMLRGHAVTFASPADARSRGIAMVPQDFALVDSMSVAENISLTDPPSRSTIYRSAAAAQRARALLGSLSRELDTAGEVGRLPLSDKQLVAICRAINSQPDVLILDEPTSVLGAKSLELIKRLVRALRDSRTSIIYITHSIAEVFEIADSVSVLVDGAQVLESAVASTTPDGLKRYFGSTGLRRPLVAPTDSGQPLLVVQNLTTQTVDNISFSVNAGDSVAVVSEPDGDALDLVKALFGATPSVTGKVTINGNALSDPASSIANGVGLLAADRRREGLFGPLGVYENVSLLGFKDGARLGVMRSSRLLRRAEQLVKDLRIKCESLRQTVWSLSGGNQQKVLLARWMIKDFAVLLLLEPTAGIDLRGKAEVHSIVSQLRGAGKTFLIASSDREELSVLCNKVLSLQNRKIARFVTADAFFGEQQR